MYNENLDIYNLYFFETMVTQAVVNNSKLASGDAVDSYFLKKAKEDKKNILEVESYQYQINIFKSFQDRLYELEILDIIDHLHCSHGIEAMELTDLVDKGVQLGYLLYII